MIYYVGNDAYREFVSEFAEITDDIDSADKIVVVESGKRAAEAIEKARKDNKPILGILDGYKAIAEAFGGETESIECAEGEQEWAVIDATSPVYLELESVIRVARGRKYAINEKTQPVELDCMSRAETGEVIAMRNFIEPKKYGSVFALNYDIKSPLTLNGKQIMKNFVNYNG